MNVDTKWISPPELMNRLGCCGGTTRELAELSGVDAATISRLRRGLFDNPKQATLRRVSKAVGAWNRKHRAESLKIKIGITPDQLLGRRKD